MTWRDPSCRYAIRRIEYEDRDRRFFTRHLDFDACDDPTDQGTLRDYWRKDHDSRPPTFAYLLVDGLREEVRGVLRYRFEGDHASADKLPPGGGPYIYLSRVGIAHGYQRARMSRILIEFFNHLVLTEATRLRLARLVLWWKCVDRTLELVRPFTTAGQVDIFDQKWSERWGPEYYLKMTLD